MLRTIAAAADDDDDDDSSSGSSSKDDVATSALLPQCGALLVHAQTLLGGCRYDMNA
jgi:hypothetical protein